MFDIAFVRLLHILAGVVWVGAGLTAELMILPTVRRLGPTGAAFFSAFYRFSIFSKVMPVASLTTTLAGLYLYARWFLSAGSLPFSTTGTIVLSVGALFGLAAFGHGISIGRLSGRFLAASIAAGESPTPEQRATLAGLQERMGRSGRVSLILMVIALVGMASARYL